MRRSYSFIVMGIEPSTDPGWRRASPSAPAAYCRVCRELVLIAFDRAARRRARQGRGRLLPLEAPHHQIPAIGDGDRGPARAGPPAGPRALPHAQFGQRPGRGGVDPGVLEVRRAYGRELGQDPRLSPPRRGAPADPRRLRALPGKLASVKREGLTWWLAFAAGLPVRSPLRPRPGVAAKPVAAGSPGLRAEGPGRIDRPRGRIEVADRRGRGFTRCRRRGRRPR